MMLRRKAYAMVLGLACLASPVMAQEKLGKQEILQALKSTDSTLRHDTWKKLNPEDSFHYKVLVQILEKLPWHDREGAIEALATAFSEETLEKMAEDLKTNRNRFVRQGMAEAFAKMNDPKFYAHLYGALEDKDPFVRRVVVHALRVHKKKEAVDALVELFQEEEDPVVRAFIENSLNELTMAFRGPDPVAWNTWWTLAKADEDYELGKIDEEAIRAAEELGLKLKERTTVSFLEDGQVNVTLESSERGSGSGVPILVIPPYGYSKKIILPFLAELERGHKLYYIDLPPISSFKNLRRAGQTDIPYYPINRLVEAFEDLREETGQEHFALIACGMNSWIAMRYAHKFPESVAALIFVNPVSSVHEYGHATRRLEGIGQQKNDIEMWHLALTRRFNTQTGESQHDQFHREQNLPKPDGESAALDRREWSLFFAYDQDSVLSMLYPIKDHRMGSVAIPDFDLGKEEPPARPIPTVVMVGTRSLFTSVQDCQKIAKFYRGPCIQFKSSAEMPYAEESEKFNTLVKKFLGKYARPKNRATTRGTP